jgi:pimeloyl-ACP methyl ester carboxylesterase
MIGRRLIFGAAAVLLGALLLSSTGCCSCFAPGKGPDPQARLSWVDGPQGRLRVEDGGRGALVPVLFVHGLAADRHVWNNQVEHLRWYRRAVSFDLRGYGESDPATNGDYSMEGYASDIAAVADALGLQKFVLVGHSMGGAIVGAYAGKHPERVAGLLFADPVGDLSKLPKDSIAQWMSGFEPQRYEAFREQWFGEMLATARPSTRDQVLADLRRVPREVVAASAKAMAAYDPLPALKAYGGPMLTVIAAQNQESYSLQNVVPGLPSKEMKDVSHWLQLDNPSGFNVLMDDFIGQVEGSKSKGLQSAKTGQGVSCVS